MMLPYRKPDLDEEDTTTKVKKSKEKEEPPGKKKGNAKQESGKKKKNKHVDLYSKEGQASSVIKLPGRHPCDCQASKHELISNCLECGRIVCSQEGKGPCLFCGNYVCNKEEMEKIRQGSRKAVQQMEKRMEGAEALQANFFKIHDQDGLHAAEAHRNKLLEFDKTCEKRTRVIDDQSDYYASDSQWLSEEQRNKIKAREDELRSKKYGSRRNTNITLDLANKCVIEEKANVDIYDPCDEVLKEMEESNFWSHEFSISNPNVRNFNLVYTETSKPTKPQNRKNSTEQLRERFKMRIQDTHLHMMSDDGLCLSMHQPWASLLVMGIKKDEGRTWPTVHRGRLWIAAAAKEPQPELIQELHNFYRLFHPGKNLEFPSRYPTGCLVGCVDVVDCLPEEIYREKFPDGESESPFVFVCENHKQLISTLPMKGQHKIFKLDKNVHKAAKACIMRNARES